MEATIDDILYRTKPYFKSRGEARIASFLNNNSISYKYEPPLLVQTDYGKQRIWYPDFYLPGLGSYIEYYGLVGNKSYDRGVKTKEVVYSKAGLHVIPVYPWMFNGNWQRYIMKELETSNRREYNSLMSTRYRPHQKSLAYKHGSFRRGYHRSDNRLY